MITLQARDGEVNVWGHRHNGVQFLATRERGRWIIRRNGEEIDTATTLVQARWRIEKAIELEDLMALFTAA